MTREVIVLQADENPGKLDWSERQLRVAAYCRVSTDDSEQMTSYEAQKEYYTAKIMRNREWIMAGIFADEGISGTSAKKRLEFQKMLRKCKQGKIDLILTKSISRFTRNTLDCITIARELKKIGVAIYFEKENINTLEMDSEFVLTILGSLAQAESESISRNVAWGKRRAMQAGNVSFHFEHIYGYERGEDGQPKIIPDQAEVIRRIFNWYLAGTTVIDIMERLNDETIPTPTRKNKWADATIRGILRNEKYCGDVLQQKTFVADVITKRVVKNQGQLPKYLIKDHHEAIVSREIFYRVQAEISRRNSKAEQKSESKRRFHRYSGKYGLNDILICGECGSVYRRVRWTKRSGEKQDLWRCVNRLENGTKYCHRSPTIQEPKLQKALLTTIKENFKPEDWQIDDHLPTRLVKREWSQQDSKEIFALKKRLTMLLCPEETDDFGVLLEQAEAEITRLQKVPDSLNSPIASIELATSVTDYPVWNETLIRSLVCKIVVQNANSVWVKFKNGKQVVLTLEP